MKNNHSFFLSSMLECFRVVRNIKFMEENEMYNMSGISLEEIALEYQKLDFTKGPIEIAHLLEEKHSEELAMLVQYSMFYDQENFSKMNEVLKMVQAIKIKRLKDAYYNKTLTEYLKKLDESEKRSLIVYLSDKTSKESAICISLLKASIELNKERNNTGLHL